MKTDRELLQQALDALETCTPADYSTGHVIHPSFDDRLVDAAIVALEEALAAPQPEPVALCDALRWSGAKESHGAMMFSPDQLRKFYEFALAAPPAAPAPGDMVMVPLKFVQDFNTLAHNYCLRAVPPDYYSGTEADAFQHAYSRCGSDLRRLREILAAAPAPADWGTPHDVSGAPWGAPAPAVCDGGTCGLGGYCTNCPRLSAAPVVREPQYWCPETGELCGKCAKTGTCEASILQAHGIGGGGK